ncbi:MAG: YgiT-type zinc finger protein [Acidobacteria bacterium]|nr:YgiT-type zinc finger protein [Acidobacteriota bacterium]
MADWYCYKDKVKMLETDVKLSYMQLSQRLPGLRCPVCGESYLTEEIVVSVVKEAENMIYGK